MKVPENYTWDIEQEKNFFKTKAETKKVQEDFSSLARLREEQHRRLSYHIKLNKPIPFHEKLEDIIAEYIMSGYLKFGDSNPTEGEQS